MKVLHYFACGHDHCGHGLGDSVMFTSVLQHIKSQVPDWLNYVVCGIGRETTFHGLCEESYAIGRQPPENEFDKVIWYQWPEPWSVFNDSPSTKTVKCISEHLHLVCDWNLLRYRLTIGDYANEIADNYLKKLPSKKGFVVLHYQGNSSADHKNFSHETISKVCNWLIKNEYNPVILDWDYRTILADEKTIFNPHANDPLWEKLGTGHTEKIAALMNKSVLNICIDSGPGKVAMALDTPHIALWHRQHPIHFADNCKHNTINLIPQNHQDHIRGDKNAGQNILDKYYRYEIYKHGRVEDSIIKIASEILKIEQKENFYEKTHPLSSIKNIFEENDLKHFDEWILRYQKLYEVVKRYQPKTIVEIGVRAGYSTWTMFQAVPHAKILGIDFDGDEKEKNVNTHGGFKGAYKNALSICSKYDFQLLLCNSHDITQLPISDMVYVDGDHTPEGCTKDLELASKTTKLIICDDYDTIFHSTGSPRFEVREAVDNFCAKYGHKKTHFDNSSTGLCLIELNNQPKML